MSDRYDEEARAWLDEPCTDSTRTALAALLRRIATEAERRGAERMRERAIARFSTERDAARAIERYGHGEEFMAAVRRRSEAESVIEVLRALPLDADEVQP